MIGNGVLLGVQDDEPRDEVRRDELLQQVDYQDARRDRDKAALLVQILPCQ